MKNAANVIVASVVLWLAPFCFALADDGWTALFDGGDLASWKVDGPDDAFAVQDGLLVCAGKPAHLVYVGDARNADFRDFELKAVVRTSPGARSALGYHATPRKADARSRARRIRIDNTPPGFRDGLDATRTGSLCGLRHQHMTLVDDGQWFTLHVTVTGNRVRVSVNETLMVDFTDPARPGRPAGGAFTIGCRDARGEVQFRRIEVRPLPEDAAGPPKSPTFDRVDRALLELTRRGFPVIDYHVHLKGGLTLDEALANSRRTGINYGIAPNCGLHFPITDDAGIDKFIEGVKGKPIFVGMQAEGREWVNLFSKQAVAKFDYVFSDSMTFTDDRGKRTRLWIPEEVEVGDPQAFMEMLVARTVTLLNNEPIDIYVNPTFLPDVIAERYDELWTEPRMQKVIDAAVENDVAIEINARLKLPSAAFIKLAKKAGAKFSFGTNNLTKELGRLEYCLEMVDQCGLTPEDMFLPRRLTPQDVLRLMGAKGLQAGTPEQVDGYRRVFHFGDKDGDGKLTKKEYIKEGRYGTPQMRTGIFRAMDRDADDVVTEREYVENRRITDECKEIFFKIDKAGDGNGTVSRAEFAEHAPVADRRTSKGIFEKMDTNGDGQVGMIECLRVWGGWARDGREPTETP